MLTAHAGPVFFPFCESFFSGGRRSRSIYHSRTKVNEIDDEKLLCVRMYLISIDMRTLKYYAICPERAEDLIVSLCAFVCVQI